MMTRVFFYGLYMDAALLESMGFGPRPVGAARLDDYQLRIGERANLVRAAGESAYGVLLDLPPDEVSALYSRPEVEGYVPRQIVVTLLADSSSQEALSYLLRSEESGSGTNVEYAARLASLASRMELPSSYIREIKAFADAP